MFWVDFATSLGFLVQSCPKNYRDPLPRNALVLLVQRFFFWGGGWFPKHQWFLIQGIIIIQQETAFWTWWLTSGVLIWSSSKPSEEGCIGESSVLIAFSDEWNGCLKLQNARWSLVSYNYIGLYNSTYRGLLSLSLSYHIFLGPFTGAPFNSMYFPIVGGRYPTRYPSRKSIGLSLTHPDTSVVVALACDRILGDFVHAGSCGK